MVKLQLLSLGSHVSLTVIMLSLFQSFLQFTVLKALIMRRFNKETNDAEQAHQAFHKVQIVTNLQLLIMLS